MNPCLPVACDVGHADCPKCGPVTTVYAVTDVELGGGDARLVGVCAGLCEQCGAAVSVSPGLLGSLEIRVPAPGREGEPPRLSDRALADLERLESQGWPRLAVSPARDLADLRRKAEFVAEGLLEMLREHKQAGRDIWAVQHRLDDALDVVDALKRLESGLALNAQR